MRPLILLLLPLLVFGLGGSCAAAMRSTATASDSTAASSLTMAHSDPLDSPAPPASNDDEIGPSEETFASFLGERCAPIPEGMVGRWGRLPRVSWVRDPTSGLMTTRIDGASHRFTIRRPGVILYDNGDAAPLCLQASQDGALYRDCGDGEFCHYPIPVRWELESDDELVLTHDRHGFRRGRESLERLPPKPYGPYGPEWFVQVPEDT